MLLTNVSIKANSVDPDQHAPTGSVLSRSTVFVEELFKHFSRQEKDNFYCLFV